MNTTDEGIAEISGGPVMFEDMGDFIVSIDVPDEDVEEWRLIEDEPMGWPFVEYWLPDKVANQYVNTLEVYISEMPEDGAVDLNLLRQDHNIFITERLSRLFHREEGTFPRSAMCACGERWTWPDPTENGWEEAFSTWASKHA